MSKNVLNIKIDNEIENNKTPIFNHYKLNDSIKTNNYHKTLYNHNFKPVVLKLNKNNEINKTLERKNSFNQISNQIIVAKNLKYKQFKKPQNLNPHTFDNYWLNKAKKASIIFNNSLLNEKYHKIKENQLNYTKVRNQYLRLNNVFNPHKNYSEVVTDRKHIIKAFLSQTKTNFNNNYYLIYSDPDRITEKIWIKIILLKLWQKEKYTINQSEKFLTLKKDLIKKIIFVLKFLHLLM